MPVSGTVFHYIRDAKLSVTIRAEPRAPTEEARGEHKDYESHAHLVLLRHGSADAANVGLRLLRLLAGFLPFIGLMLGSRTVL